MNKKKYAGTVAFYTCAWFVYFAMSWFIVSRNDDFVFKAGIERYGSFIGWVNFFSHNWGGRIIPQGILVLLLQTSEIWFHLLNASMWFILLLYICRVFDYEGMWNRKAEFLVLSFSIFAFIPVSVLAGSVFWKCANVLYLWGTAGMLVAIYPFVCIAKGNRYKRCDLVLAFIACIYTSSFEQGAIFMAAGIIVLLLYDLLKEKKIDRWLCLLAGVSCALTLLFYKMSGNEVRTKAEVLGSFPKFDMFSLPDKILLGIRYAVENSEAQVTVLYVIMVFIVFVSVFRNRRKDKFFKTIAWILIGYFIFCWVIWEGKSITGNDENILERIYLCINVDTVSFTFSFIDALLECIHIGMIALLGCMLVMIILGRVNPLTFISYFGGLATMAVMGFSPTIYASAERPRFIGYLMLLCTVFCCVCDLKHFSVECQEVILCDLIEISTQSKRSGDIQRINNSDKRDGNTLSLSSQSCKM